MENIDIGQLNEEIREKSAFLGLVQQEISKSIIGQKYMTERLMIALLCQGHILLEGLPGLAKTLAIKSLADAISVKFNRIQFTPDLLPADIVGTMIYNQAKGNFEVRKGPVFANFLLADEINRAPAKVQSALLQAMQERMITIGDTTYPLEEPFMVMATQNPIEQEGTYPLPEAQVDRFMLKVKISYPEYEEERYIIRQSLQEETPKINAVVDASSIIEARKLVKRIYMDEKIEKYILDIVFASRQPEKYKLHALQNLISFGASPRASISLAMASKAYAFMRNRGFVIPEDVRAVCYDVMRHRIGITYEAEAENLHSDAIIGQIISKIEVP